MFTQSCEKNTPNGASGGQSTQSVATERRSPMGAFRGCQRTMNIKSDTGRCRKLNIDKYKYIIYPKTPVWSLVAI